MIPPDLIVSVGAFGAAVARSLSASGTQVVSVPVAGGDIAVPAAAATVVLAASVGAPAVELELSRAAHEGGFAFLPIVLEHPRLRVGPVSRAGSRGCSACYRNRTRQHALNVAAEDALEEHHRRDPVAADRGYLAHWPALAAALAGQVDPLVIRQFDLLSNTPLVSRLVPVHGCGVCASAPPDAPQLRSIARLRSIVEGLEDR
ncbi:hypothetical protein ACU635_33465 [[Actinomadura] parvosata]|uniref:hypothetical protein n=1 Tax=[Actinomadura] parvosata TaxID=1955412 RepID=UPI00406D0224